MGNTLFAQVNYAVEGVWTVWTEAGSAIWVVHRSGG